MKIELNTTWKQMAILAVIVALLVTGVGGLVYNSQIVQPGFARVTKLVSPPGDINAEAVGTGRFTNIYGTLRTLNQPYVTGLGTITTFTATNATLTSANVTTATVSSALALDSQTFTGARRGGTASTVISGTTIAHGFTTTPTFMIVVPNYLLPTTFTQTLYAHSCNTISCTVAISEGSVITYTTVQWEAGR